MTALRIEWAAPSKKQFDELQQRAIATGHVGEFLATHNQIVDILGDLEQTTEKSDPLYNTKKPGGRCASPASPIPFGDHLSFSR